MEFKDYYATLGVTKAASEAEIKRAYRKLARQHHPDLNPGDKKAEARFKDINEANEVLGNPESRRKYDELGANWRAYEQAPPGARDAGSGWADGFRNPRAGGARQRTMTPEEMEAAFGSQDPFSDFFQTFFGGAGAQADPRRARSARSGRAVHGHDVEQPVELTLEEAFAGTTRRVESAPGGKERTFDVRIPAGVNDGVKIRAAGEGGQAEQGGRAGDLYLTVRIQPHPRFERRGQDLYVRVDVPVPVAIRGGEMSVPTLSGAPVRLKVPELTPQGRTFRLRGHGMPAVGKPDERGDLYASVQLQIPSSLSDEARRHYDALKMMEVG